MEGIPPVRRFQMQVTENLTLPQKHDSQTSTPPYYLTYIANGSPIRLVPVSLPSLKKKEAQEQFFHQDYIGS